MQDQLAALITFTAISSGVGRIAALQERRKSSRLSSQFGRGCVKTQIPKIRVVNCYRFAWPFRSKVGYMGKLLAINTI